MSTQAELAQLIEDADQALHEIPGVAVSEVNRVAEGIQHARSAAASMQVDVPEPVAPTVTASPSVAADAEPVAGVSEAAPEPAVEAASVPVEESPAPEAAADTEAQDVPSEVAPDAGPWL